MSTSPNPVWDLPTRLFHWGVVALMAGAWITVELGDMELHRACGYGVLGLVLFRLIWGFVGSRHARFADFVRGPGAVLRYLRGAPAEGHGHNPAGGWSVLLLLALLTVQGISGLFTTDEVLFQGPFYPSVSEETAGIIGAIHHLNFNLLLAFVALHVTAVVFYRKVKGVDLVTPMVLGSSAARQGVAPAVPLWRALIVAAVAAGLLAAVLAAAPPPVSYEF
ncbi:cytochrome b/b6 domain-containing protein [Endothiovibrio diazotrophicus]